MTAMLPGVWSAEAGPEDAELVVLVHGSMDRSAGMLKVSRLLDDRFRVLRYDRRGYGRSHPHDGPHTIADQVDDLAALIGDRQAIVIGHSFGGNVALAAGQRHSRQIRAVGVYESPMSWTEWWPGNTPAAKAVGLSADPEQATEQFMRAIIGTDRWEALPARTRAARLAEGPTMLAELAALRAGAPWEASLIDVPVVVGRGELARPHHRQAMEQLAVMFGHPGPVVLPGCTHDAPNSAPGEYARFVELVAAAA